MKTGSRWMKEELDATSRAAKKSALESYPSQLAFTPRYLRSFLRRNELFAVVPEQNMLSQKQSDAPRSIVLDASRDSLLHNLMPSADLQSVALMQGNQSKITLRLQSMKTPLKTVELSRVAAQHWRR